MKVLVAGYGNPFREDDRVGHELAPLIHQYLVSRNVDAELWIEQQLLPEVVEDMRDKDVAFFIDASAEGLADGFLINEMEPDPDIEGLNIHSMGPAWILDLMRSLDIPYPETFLISVSGHSFNFSEEMTSICRERMEKAFEGFTELWKKRYSS